MPVSKIESVPPVEGIPGLDRASALLRRAAARDAIAWLRLLTDPSDAAATVRLLGRPPIELRQVDIARVVQVARKAKLDLLAGLPAAIESPGMPPEARERIERFLALHAEVRSAFEALSPRLPGDPHELAAELTAASEVGALTGESGSERQAQTLRETLELMREEVIAGAARIAGRLGELRLDTDLDISHGVVRYLELVKLNALRERPPGQSLQEALADVNQRLLAACTPLQREIFQSSALDRTLLAAERGEGDTSVLAGSEGKGSASDENSASASGQGSASASDENNSGSASGQGRASASDQGRASASDQGDASALAVDAKRGAYAQSRRPAVVPGVGEAFARREEPSLLAFIPRRGDGLVLSASDIDTYRACPLRYKFARVLKLPTPQTQHQRFGIAVHQTLERYHAADRQSMPHSGHAAGSPPIGDRRDLRSASQHGTVAQMLDLFETCWRRGGFGANEAERNREGTSELHAKARAALVLYHRHLEAHEAEPVWFERSFSFKLGPHHLRGRVDRVDRLPDGSYEMIDYKTSRPRSAEQLRDDVQLSLYALGAHESWQVKADRLSYYYVLDDVKVPVPSAEMDPDWIARVVAEVGEAISAERFEPTPAPATCALCDYRIACPAWER